MMFKMQSRLAKSMPRREDSLDSEEEDVRRATTEAFIPYKFGADAASIRPLVRAMTLASARRRASEGGS